MIERQSPNVTWAIINKGPFQLHPSLSNFILPTEVWFCMPDDEKESYVKMVRKSSVAETVCNDLQETTLSLDVLANAACTLSTSHAVQHTDRETDADVIKMPLTFFEFQVYLHGQPQETLRGIWDKAKLISAPEKMTPAPCCPQAAGW